MRISALGAWCLNNQHTRHTTPARTQADKYTEEAQGDDTAAAPMQQQQVKVCDEQDIFAEGNSFDLTVRVTSPFPLQCVSAVSSAVCAFLIW